MLVYTPTLSGLKEEILLAKYAGVNTFTFLLNTDGLGMYQENGRWYLAETQNAQSRVELGDVVTFDANGRFSVGTMTVEPLTNNQSYRLALTVDKGNSNWTESGATWNNVGADNFGDWIDTVNHGRSVEASYDITDLLKGWKEGESAATAGFILCHSNEETATNNDPRMWHSIVVLNTTCTAETQPYYFGT